jgi:hypothetical protein
MDINPTALGIIAFFTAVAALSGDWLVGLTVGLGTILVCTIANRRDDVPIIVLGFVVLLVLLLATPAGAAGPLDRECAPSPRDTYVMTACQARDVVALVADEKTRQRLVVGVYSCHRVDLRGFRCRPHFYSPRWEYVGRVVVHVKRGSEGVAYDFRLKAINRATGRTRNVRWSDF